MVEMIANCNIFPTSAPIFVIFSANIFFSEKIYQVCFFLNFHAFAFLTFSLLRMQLKSIQIVSFRRMFQWSEDFAEK